MKTKIYHAQDSIHSVELPFSYSKEMNLKLSNYKNNDLLEWNGKAIAHVQIKDDVFYLKLNEDAPLAVVSDFPLQKTVLIEAVNAVKIQKDTNLDLKTLCIEAGSLDYQGNITSAESVNLIARDSLVISGSLNNLKESYLEADTIHLQNKASVELNPDNSINQMKASKIVVDKGARLKLNQTVISGAEIQSHGEVILDQCNLIVKNLDFQGPYSINNSICTIDKSAILFGDNRSTLNNLQFEAENLVFSGENNIQDVNFISDDVQFSEGNNSNFINCSLNIQNSISLKEKAHAQLKNSIINTSTLNLSGKVGLENCTVESDILITSANTTINSSKILAAEFWQDTGAKVKNSKIKAQSTTLLNEIDIQHSKLKTNTFSHVGTGKVEDSKIYIFDYMHTSKESNLTFKHSYLKSGQNYSQGILNFNEGSYHQCNYLQQSAGEIRVNGSVIENENLLYTIDGAQLIAKDKSRIQVKTALFEGDDDWSASQLNTIGPIVFCGKTIADNTSIKSEDSIFLAKSSHELNKTAISSTKDILVSGDLTLNQSKLGCSHLIFSGQNKQIDNSQIDASELTIIDQFSAKKSLINLQKNFETLHKSSTVIEDTKVSASSMNFAASMSSKLSEFKAKENINFESTSNSNFQSVKLNAEGDIINVSGSQMTGTSLDLKANHFANHGSIDIEKFAAHAGTILNTGSLESDQLQLKANLAVVNENVIKSKNINIQAGSFTNLFGEIHSTQSTVIKAPLAVNFGSKLTSEGSLSIDSLTHYNLFGLERAYDLNIRSLHNNNFGLMLPYLPKSYKDIFTFSRGLNYASMMLNQFLPQYSNVISIGKMAVPYVMQSGQYLRDFYRSKSPLSSLPAKLYNSAVSSGHEFVAGFQIKEASDVLPVMLNAMSTTLGAAQFVKSAAGAFNEINAASKEEKEGDSATPPTETTTTKSSDEILQDAIFSLGENAIKVFGPSMNIQSLYNRNAGIALSANLTESSFDETNSGVKCGWNIVGDYKHGTNRGIYAGANVVSTGNSYENFGSFTGFNKASLLFKDSLVNAEGSSLNLSNFHIRTGKIENSAELNLSKGKLEADSLTSTGNAHLSGVAAFLKEEANLSGAYSLTNQSTLSAKELNLSDEGLIQQSMIIGRENLNQSGHLVAEESIISGENVSLCGTEATDGKISAEHNLTISNSTTLGTGLAAENANLKDSTFKGRKAPESDGEQPSESENNQSKAASSANKLDVKDNLVTENIVMENMQIESGSHKDSSSNYKESTIKTARDFRAKNSTFDQTVAHAKDIHLSEKTELISSQFKADNLLKQTGNCKAEESTLIGKNVSTDGLNATGGRIIAEEKLNINHSKTSGTGIGAKNAHLKNSTFKGQKAAQAEDKIEGEDKDSEESQQSPQSEPAANQIKVDEQLTTSNIVMEDMQISSSLHRDYKGSYQRTDASAKTFNGNNSQFENSSYHSNEISLTGETRVNSSQLYAENKLTQKGHLIGEEALFSGRNVTMDGIELNKSFIQSEKKLNLKNAKTLDCGLSAETMHLQDSVFKATPPPTEENTDKESKTTSDEPTNAESKPEDIKDSGSNQIKAEKTITTNNIVFEGQSVRADKMAMNKSQMNSSHAKISKTFDSKDNVINKSKIESNQANFKGNNSLSETLVKAKSAIVFEKQGHLKTHDCEFDGGKKILHASANHEQTGGLLFKAKDVQTTTTTHLYSGKGENNAFYVQAETGNFQGAMDLDNGSFDVKNLKNAGDLIGKKGQSKKQNFSKSLSLNIDEAVTLEHMKPRDCNIAIRAKEINVKTAYKSEYDLTLIASEKNVSVNAEIGGEKVVLQSEKAHVEVTGTKVEGKNYVYVEAAKDIKVSATERHFEGKYSTEVEYTQAQIVGGRGNEETGGAGVILKAKNKAIIDASNVVAVGKTIVSGDKGVEFKARSHSYVSERKSRNKRVLGVKHGKKKTETTTANVCVSTLGSVDDQVQIISSKGGVNGVAGNFIAAKGTDIYSYKDIKLQSLITETKIKKRETGCFGLNSKKKNEKHENVNLVEFVSKGGETRLHSHKGHIIGTDLRFQGGGNLRFETPKGSTFLQSSKLNHSIKTRERKVSVSSPFVDSAKRAVGNKKRFAKQADPVIEQAETLAKAKTPQEMMAAASNLAIGGYNSACALAEGAYSQQLMQRMGFTPKIDLSLTLTESSAHYQTGTGAGIYMDGDVSFFAKDQVELVGMPIIANNLGMKANQIGMRGHAFESSFSQKSTTATVGISPTGGVTDASVNHSSQKMNAIQYQNMQVQIKNKVTIEAKLMEMDAANITCDKIKTEIEKYNGLTRQDVVEHSTKNYSASTTGSVSMNQSKTQSKQVNQATGIHVISGIAKGDMEIGEANLIGSTITTDGHNGFEPGKLTTKTVKDSSHTRGFGIAGNVNSLANALDSEPAKTSQLTTFSVSHEKRDYAADNRATIYGKEGVSEQLKLSHPHLNTTSAQSKRVTRDRAENISLDIPVEIVKTSIKTGIGFFKVAKPENRKIPPSCEKLEKSQEISSIPSEQPTPEACSEYEEVIEISSPTQRCEANQQIEDNTPIESAEIEKKTDDVINPIVKPLQFANSESEALTEIETETVDICGPFNPNLQMQRLGLKNGRYGQQICNKENGQYTNVDKELNNSNENSKITTGVEYTILESGDGTDGLYYNVKIDPLSHTLSIDAGLGDEYVFNIYSDKVDLGYFGSSSYRIDACSAQALINTQMELSFSRATATMGGEFGLMGPSGSASYASPTFNLMGFTFQISVEGSAGVGLKIAAGIGAEANAQKMNVSAVAKLGFFSGAGASATLKPSVGLDHDYLVEHPKRVKEIIENDPSVMRIYEKMKNFEIPKPWEIEEFDNAFMEADIRARFGR
ncbi:MAG: hemagglutinin repeat-containing protein [Tatlockia sp.]|nr:hemagglutinin repeat-containing protein [Tatlockia sp.]